MKRKIAKIIVYGILFITIITIGFIVYSSNRSNKEVPRRAKLVEIWESHDLKG